MPAAASPQTGATAVSSPRIRAFGRGLAVLSGWYLTVAAGVGVWVFSLADVKGDDCCGGLGFGCTPSPRDGAALMVVIFVIPGLLAGFAGGVALLGALSAARVRSGIVSGTASAVLGIAAVAGIAALWTPR
jgi:hypothetical protein